MKLYQSFNQEVKTPYPIKGGKIRHKTEYIKKRREINLQQELQGALNYGGIERNLKITQNLLLARYAKDEKTVILDILNDWAHDDYSSLSFKAPFEFEGQWIDVWEYELED